MPALGIEGRLHPGAGLASKGEAQDIHNCLAGNRLANPAAQYGSSPDSPLEREGFSPSPVAETILEETAAARLRFGSSPASRAHKDAPPDGSGLRSSRSL